MFKVFEYEGERCIWDVQKKRAYTFPTRHRDYLKISKKIDVEPASLLDLEISTGAIYFVEFVKTYLSLKYEQPNNLKPTRLLRSIIDICKLSTLVKATSKAIENLALITAKEEEIKTKYISFSECEKFSIVRDVKGRAYKIKILNKLKPPSEIIYLITDPRNLLKVLFNTGSGWFYASNPHNIVEVQGEFVSLADSKDIPIEKILAAEEKERTFDKEAATSAYKFPLDNKVLEKLYQYLYFIFRDAFDYSLEVDGLLREEALMSHGQAKLLEDIPESININNSLESARSIRLLRSSSSGINFLGDNNVFPTTREVIQDIVQCRVMENILKFYSNSCPTETQDLSLMMQWKLQFSELIMSIISFVNCSIKAHHHQLVKSSLEALGGIETIETMQITTRDSFLIYFRKNWRKLFIEEFSFSETQSKGTEEKNNIFSISRIKNLAYEKKLKMRKSKLLKAHNFNINSYYKLVDAKFWQFFCHAQFPDYFISEKYITPLHNLFIDVWELCIFMALQMPSMTFGPLEITQIFQYKTHMAVKDSGDIKEGMKVVVLMPFIQKGNMRNTDYTNNIMSKAAVVTLQ